MAKKSIVMPEQFYKGVQLLPPEQQGEAYNAYLEYAFYGKKYDGGNIAIAVLIASVSDSIDTANANYEKKLKNLKKKKTSPDSKETVTDSKETVTDSKEAVIDSEETVIDSDTDTVTDTVIDTVIDISPNGDKEKPNANALGKKKPRPTLEEVQAYADEKGRPEEAEHFYDFYTANGWKVGRNPMKDWRAAFRNWLKNDFDRGKPKLSEADFYASLAEAERTSFGKL